MKKEKNVDYMSFAKDMLKLCKRHKIKIIAHNEGFVGLGPASAYTTGDYPYSELVFSPELVKMNGILIKE